MKPDQETWINTVLSSLDDLERTSPNPFLLAKIRHKLAADNGMVLVPKRTVWLAAATFALLTLLNWSLLNRPATASATTTQASIKAFVEDMQLYPTVPQLYDTWNGPNY
ncbi:hypothetical protein GCM10023187_46720 [Nibrella viscosa]|uniref:Uncharacterized protein n=1 Tax=Nibrella viscosa TaxID=1084524 RepID=A0ABP8KT63_9BACT